MNETDIRDEFIRRVSTGKTFVDVGGLWRVTSEKLSVAYASGASEVTMFDRASTTDPDWEGLGVRMEEMRIPYKAICGDFLSYPSRPFDVVHSAGMLYHMTNPLDYIKRLRTVTKDYAIITTAVTQEHISNSQGEFKLPPSGVIFMPAITEQERLVLAEYWQPWATVTGVSEPRTNFSLAHGGGGWIWLPTATAFKRMVEAFDFTILDEGPYWHGNAYTVLVQ